MPVQRAVHAFINERLQAKLDKAKSPQEINDLKLKYHPHEWIADAARRASQIQFATHTVKGIHPDSKGTNINAQLIKITDGLVSSADLNTHALDIVGNAAALDVYKFLSVSVDENSTILDLVLKEDSQLLSVFSESPQQAKQYLAAFKSITQSSMENAKVYELMKQLLWPVNIDAQQQDNYLNIVPLYPTSFVHQVYQNLQEIRFSDEVKLAKDARKNEKGHEVGYTIVPDIAYVKLGGTKPQNISQLNSERGGRNYLLPSLPPTNQPEDTSAWRVKPPVLESSIFDRVFNYFAKKHIKRFCQNVIDESRNNASVREKRQLIIKDILEVLMRYGEQVRGFDGGWSKHGGLKASQAFWLDPKRADIDAEWAELRETSDWKMELAHDFGVWLNHRLNDAYRDNKYIHLADTEQKEWKYDMADLIKQSIREGWGIFE
ncbi:type I-F CRISPR-associated protein Csy1 [Pragia fontium]|uniref:Type I-F CRISPR-associated protein Csy1 n=1 Tax=Pragia fontium TaxID=82985 RepID=A0ABQ5LGB5_9GAMM|nr:type I-F CRISPR-associated protein Csy1 [Pragia fontium]GKX62022.1 type I-F CRISPR-associated protein Csy1 [Pragia fontium]VEJ54882.1 CRISPR type I-F/YPEST-associated protein Csy1 [Pragia fontium]